MSQAAWGSGSEAPPPGSSPATCTRRSQRATSPCSREPWPRSWNSWSPPRGHSTGRSWGARSQLVMMPGVTSGVAFLTVDRHDLTRHRDREVVGSLGARPDLLLLLLGIDPGLAIEVTTEDAAQPLDRG